MDTNYFKCVGKFAGIEENRSTPGGINISEFTLAVKTLVPWKQAYYSNLTIKTSSELAYYLETLNTGEIITVEGIIEAVGKKANKVINLLATKIIKENNNE